MKIRIFENFSHIIIYMRFK